MEVIMLIFNDGNIQISPCILSKGRFALGLKDSRPTNTKRCSLRYWIRVIDTLCASNNIQDENSRLIAIERFDELMNN